MCLILIWICFANYIGLLVFDLDVLCCFIALRLMVVYCICFGCFVILFCCICMVVVLFVFLLFMFGFWWLCFLFVCVLLVVFAGCLFCLGGFAD